MSIEEISAEELTRIFFHYHETLAPKVWSAEGSQPKTWNDVPWSERNRMIAAARLALQEMGDSRKTIEVDSNRYFATPGMAEWGC